MASTAMGLDRERYTPHVGTLRAGGFRLAELEAAGVRSVLFPVPSFQGMGWWRGRGAVRRYVEREGIRIVHSFDAPANMVAAPGAYGKAIVVTSQRAFRELVSAWRRTALRATDRLADRIVVNCQALERHLVDEESVPAAKVRVCYNGIDTERFTPGDRTEGTEITVGVVCALRPEKDLLTLAEGFAAARRTRPELRLLVVGSGPEREPLERRLDELGVRGAAHLEPSTPDVTRWLRQMDIFVLPSKSEAFSNALMEAMACGCACVASRVGGNPELVREEETGLLFPVGDAAALGAALDRLAADRALRRRLAASGMRRIREEFALPVAARRMEEIYAEALAGGR